MPKANIESFKTPEEFLDHYQIQEEMVAHLKYLSIKIALQGKEINTQSYNILRGYGVISLYDFGKLDKKDLYEFRNLGRKGIEKYITPWLERHHAPWLNDYRNKDVLINKLQASQDYFKENYLEQHQVKAAAVKEAPQEKAALSSGTAQEAHIRSFVIAGINTKLGPKDTSLQTRLDTLSGRSARLPALRELRELSGMPDGQGGFFDVLGDVVMAGRETFVAMQMNQDDINGINAGLEFFKLNLDMRQHFEDAFWQDTDERAEDYQRIQENLPQELRIMAKKRDYHNGPR